MDDSGLEGKRVLLLYDGGALSGDVASRDVAEQLAAVEEGLAAQGARPARLAVGLDLAAFRRDMERRKPDLLFNLVESLDGSDRLQTLIPMLLENWRLPFTGSGSAALFLSNHKILAKRFFAARRLPTPDCAWLENGRLLFSGGFREGDWLIKTAASHASLHLDDASLLRRPDPAELERRLLRAWREFGQPFFAERFVDGREFNLGLIAGGDGSPETLPAAEIDFSRLPAGRPRIVGYAAKWDGNSEEFLATPRVFGLGGGDRALADELRRLALAAWRLLGLAGYARVDFRVDREGRPFILEANANPCLSPDAGLAAAAARAGCGHHSLVRRIALAGMGR